MKHQLYELGSLEFTKIYSKHSTTIQDTNKAVYSVRVSLPLTYNI